MHQRRTEEVGRRWVSLRAEEGKGGKRGGVRGELLLSSFLDPRPSRGLTSFFLGMCCDVQETMPRTTMLIEVYHGIREILFDEFDEEGKEELGEDE